MQSLGLEFVIRELRVCDSEVAERETCLCHSLVRMS